MFLTVIARSLLIEGGLCDRILMSVIIIDIVFDNNRLIGLLGIRLILGRFKASCGYDESFRDILCERINAVLPDWRRVNA